MSFLNTLESIAKGATTGVAVGSTVGALAALIDKMNKRDLKKSGL